LRRLDQLLKIQGRQSLSELNEFVVGEITRFCSSFLLRRICYWQRASEYVDHKRGSQGQLPPVQDRFLELIPSFQATAKLQAELESLVTTSKLKRASMKKKELEIQLLEQKLKRRESKQQGKAVKSEPSVEISAPSVEDILQFLSDELPPSLAQEAFLTKFRPPPEHEDVEAHEACKAG